MGQTRPFYSTEQFVFDILNMSGPDVLADVALKCIALAIAAGTLNMETLMKFALTCVQNDETLRNHFLRETRSGSLEPDRA